MLAQFLEGFQLGSASILTTACLLPLYPGLIAFLAGNAENERSRRATPVLGVVVLAGVLTMMVALGLLMYLISSSLDNALTIALPIAYIIVVVFGVMMFFGRNPFVKVQTVQAPMLKNPYATAYTYGLLFGPMTLPCTGPIILSAFTLAAVDGGLLVDQLVYALGFGMGFGWPLVILPLLAMPVQQRLVRTLTKHKTLLDRAAGILLVAVGVFGFLTELAPIWWTAFPTFDTTTNLLFWAGVAVLIVAVGVFTWWQQQPRDSGGPDTQERPAISA